MSFLGNYLGHNAGTQSDDEEEKAQPVQYGDVIVLQSSSGSYLSADAVTQKVCLLKIDDSSDPDNFIECLWRVMPELSFAEQRQGSASSTRVLGEMAKNYAIFEKALNGCGKLVLYGHSVIFRHELTGSCLTANQLAAILERGCLRVTLHDEASAASHFKLKPKFKVRTEGGMVFFNDEMFVRSMEVDEYALHGSRRAINRSIDPPPTLCEANLSVKATSFAVRLFGRFKKASPYAAGIAAGGGAAGGKGKGAGGPGAAGGSDGGGVDGGSSSSPEDMYRLSQFGPNYMFRNNKTLLTSMPVRLFHRETDSFLCGSANPKKVPHTHKPYYKRHTGDEPITSKEAFNAKSVFCIEGLSRKNGFAVKWNSPVRIKHIPSGKYLTVVRKNVHHVGANVKNLAHQGGGEGRTGSEETKGGGGAAAGSADDAFAEAGGPGSGSGSGAVQAAVVAEEKQAAAEEAMSLGGDEVWYEARFEVDSIARAFVPNSTDPAVQHTMELEKEREKRQAEAQKKAAKVDDKAAAAAAAAAAEEERKEEEGGGRFFGSPFAAMKKVGAATGALKTGIMTGVADSMGAMLGSSTKWLQIGTQKELSESQIFFLKPIGFSQGEFVPSEDVSFEIEHRISKPLGGGHITVFLHSDSTMAKQPGDSPRSYKIFFSNTRREQDAVLMLGVNPTTYLMMERLKYMVRTLNSYVFAMNNGFQFTKHAQISNELDSLKMLIFDTVLGDEDEDVNAFIYEGRSDPAIQNIAREMKVLETLMTMIQVPLFNGYALDYNVKERQWVDEKFGIIADLQILTFKCVRHLFQDNRTCEEYFAAEYFTLEKTEESVGKPNPVFCRIADFDDANDPSLQAVPWMQVLISQVPYPLGAATCMSTLIMNNPHLLEQYVDSDTIGRFKALIQSKGPRAQYMDFYANVCTCQNRGVRSKQELTLKELVLDPQTKAQLLIEIVPYSDDQVKKAPWASIYGGGGGGEGGGADGDGDGNGDGDGDGAAVDCLGARVYREGSERIFVRWASTDNWSPDSGSLFYSAKAIGLPEVQIGTGNGLPSPKKGRGGWGSSQSISARMGTTVEDFCWPIEPERLCEKITGRAWLDYKEEMGQNDGLKKRFDLHKQLAEYFRAQVEMYAGIAKDRSYNCINKLEKEVSYESLVTLLGNSRLPSPLRASISNLLLNLWIDRNPHTDNCGKISFPDHVWILSEVADIDLDRDPLALPHYFVAAAEAGAAQKDPFFACTTIDKFRLVEDAIGGFFAELGGRQDISDLGQNMLVLAILGVLNKLMGYGFYSTAPKLAMLCKDLAKLLDGRLDVLENDTAVAKKSKGRRSSFADADAAAADGASAIEGEGSNLSISNVAGGVKKRYGTDPNTALVVDCKVKVLEILVGVRKFKCHYLLNKVVYYFKEWMEENPDQAGRTEVGFSTLSRRMSQGADNDDSAGPPVGRVKLSRMNSSFIQMATETSSNINVVLEQASALVSSEQGQVLDFSALTGGAPLDSILLDLMMYESDQLFGAAFNMLDTESNPRLALSTLLEDIIVLRTSNIPVFGSFAELQRVVTSLKNHIDSFDTWGISDSFSQKDTTICDEVLQSIQNLKVLVLKGPTTASGSGADKKTDNLAAGVEGVNIETVEGGEEEEDASTTHDPSPLYQDLLSYFNIYDILIRIFSFEKAFVEENEAAEARSGSAQKKLKKKKKWGFSADDKDDSPGPDRAEKYSLAFLLRETMGLFRILVHRNRRNQAAAHVHIGVLTRWVQYDIGAIDVISAIFKDHAGLCRETSPDLFYQFAAIADAVQEPQMLEFFTDQIQPASLVLTRNQNLTLNAILDGQFHNIVQVKTPLEVAKAEERAKLATKAAAKAAAATSKLFGGGGGGAATVVGAAPAVGDYLQGKESYIDYHLAVLSVLGMCCNGRNTAATAKVQPLLDLDHLLEQVADVRCPDRVLSVYLEVINVVFFNTALIADGLSTNKTFWEVALPRFIEVLSTGGVVEDRELTFSIDGAYAQAGSAAVSGLGFMKHDIVYLLRSFFMDIFKVRSPDPHIRKTMESLCGVLLEKIVVNEQCGVKMRKYATDIIDEIGLDGFDVPASAIQSITVKMRQKEASLPRASTVTADTTPAGAGGAGGTGLESSGALLTMAMRTSPVWNEKVEEDMLGFTLIVEHVEELTKLPPGVNLALASPITFEQLILRMKAFMAANMHSPDPAVQQIVNRILNVWTVHLREKNDHEGGADGTNADGAVVEADDPDDFADYEGDADVMEKLVQMQEMEKDLKAMPPNKQPLHIRQRKMANLGVLDVAHAIIVRSHSRDLMFTALEFAVAMMKGGNIRVQKEFYRVATSTDMESAFFHNLYQLITRCSDTMRDLQPILAELNVVSLNRSDARATEGSNPADAIQANVVNNAKEDSRAEALIIRLEARKTDVAIVIDLLSLLCAKQYRPMQDLLREQPRKSMSYDLLTVTSRLLTEFVRLHRFGGYEFSRQDINFFTQCFGFLEAALNGPCPGNQALLSEGEIVEVCSYLLGAQMSHIKQRRHVFEAKHSCIRLLAACVDNRKDQTMHKKIVSGMDVSVLNKTIVEVYKLLRVCELFAAHGDELLMKHTDTRRERLQKKLRYRRASAIDQECFAADIQLSFFERTGVKEEDVPSMIPTLKDMMVDVQTIRTELAYVSIEVYSILGPAKKTGISDDPAGADLYQVETEVNARLGRVEVFRDDHVELIYFLLPEEWRSLTKTTQHEFMQNVDLSTVEGRKKDFVESADKFIDEMEVLSKLDKNPFYIFLRDHYFNINLFAYIMVIMATFNMIVSVQDSSSSDIRHTSYSGHHEVSYVLIGFAFASYLALVLYWLLSIVPITRIELTRLVQKTKHENKNAKRRKYSAFNTYFASMPIYAVVCYIDSAADDDANKDGYYQCFVVLYAVWGAFLLRKYIIIPDTHWTFMYAWFFDCLTNVEVFTHLVWMVFMFPMGILKSYFITFVLLDCYFLSPYVRDTVRAVFIPYKAIMNVFIIFFVVIVIYAVSGYFIFKENSFFEDDDGEIRTTNLIESFWWVLYTSIIELDISAALRPINHTQGSYFYKRIFFDLIFYIVFGVLLFNMVTGIIVDTFSALREETQERTDKLTNECFISGLTREHFEDAGFDFDHHVKYEQHPWNYIFLLLYLRRLDSKLYNAGEKYVMDKMKRGDYSWIPTRRAYILENQPKSDPSLIKKGEDEGGGDDNRDDDSDDSDSDSDSDGDSDSGDEKTPALGGGSGGGGGGGADMGVLLEMFNRERKFNASQYEQFAGLLKGIQQQLEEMKKVQEVGAAAAEATANDSRGRGLLRNSSAKRKSSVDKSSTK